MKKENVILLLEQMKMKHEQQSEKEGTSKTGFYRAGALEATKWAIELVEAIECDCGE